MIGFLAVSTYLLLVSLMECTTIKMESQDASLIFLPFGENVELQSKNCEFFFNGKTAHSDIFTTDLNLRDGDVLLSFVMGPNTVGLFGCCKHDGDECVKQRIEKEGSPPANGRRYCTKEENICAAHNTRKCEVDSLGSPICECAHGWMGPDCAKPVTDKSTQSMTDSSGFVAVLLFLIVASLIVLTVVKVAYTRRRREAEQEKLYTKAIRMEEGEQDS